MPIGAEQIPLYDPLCGEARARQIGFQEDRLVDVEFISQSATGTPAPRNVCGA